MNLMEHLGKNYWSRCELCFAKAGMDILDFIGGIVRTIVTCLIFRDLEQLSNRPEN